MKERMSHLENTPRISPREWFAFGAMFLFVFISCAGGGDEATEKFIQEYLLGKILICNKQNSIHVRGDGEPIPFLNLGTGCESNKLESGFVYNFDTNALLINPITAGQNLICKCSSASNGDYSDWSLVPSENNPPGLYPNFIAEQPVSPTGIPGPFTQYQSGDILLCVPRKGFPFCPNGFHYQIARVI